jgi:hypothetical protein
MPSIKSSYPEDDMSILNAIMVAFLAIFLISMWALGSMPRKFATAQDTRPKDTSGHYQRVVGGKMLVVLKVP